MTNEQPSFKERVAQMYDAAEQLKIITETVTAGAGHMAAVVRCWHGYAILMRLVSRRA